MKTKWLSENEVETCCLGWEKFNDEKGRAYAKPTTKRWRKKGEL